MTSKAEDSKKQGNDCIKEKKYIEAMIHYTQAIKLEPNNHLLFSNRSLAFLKMDQHFHALEDAKRVTQLQPDWPKGYYRKGEVEHAAEHYKEAVQSFKQGLLIEPNDTGLQDAVAKSSKAFKEQKSSEGRMPWMGGLGGFFFGLLIVVGDEMVSDKPTLEYVVLKFLVAAIVTSFGVSIAMGYRYFIKSQRDSLLDKPLDLFGDGEDPFSPPPSSQSSPTEGPVPPPEGATKQKQKGGAAGARQRYRKGKS